MKVYVEAGDIKPYKWRLVSEDAARNGQEIVHVSNRCNGTILIGLDNHAFTVDRDAVLTVEAVKART